VAGGEQRPGPAQDDDPHGVVGLGLAESVVEFDQEAAVLGVPGPGPVQGDPGDEAVVEQLVPDVAEFGHRRDPFF
jgi:hypothetical protein